MTLGANQIAAYAADLLDTEEQIDALQMGKRDTYKAIREEHGKAEADALKRAVKLSRMDAEKRDEAEAVDTEAQRMLEIIQRGTVNATHVARGARDDQSTAARKDVQQSRQPLETAPSGESRLDTKDGVSEVAGTQAPPVDTKFPERQPGCQHPEACAGTWRQRCHSCERAFTAEHEVSA